jgi:glycosyltransferase involved in cell wall biosynthesis
MKVLHYISDFSLPSETFIYDLIINLNQHERINNFVLTQRTHLETERPFENKIVLNENFPSRVYHKIRDFQGYTMVNPVMVQKAITDIDPDIIHSHFGPNGIRMNDILKKYNLNIPHLVSFHGTDINSLPDVKRNYLKNVHELCKQENTYFTAPSQFLRNKMINRGIPEEKITVVKNSFNTSFLSAEKQKEFRYGDTLKLINVGRLESVKGQKYLIEAFSKLKGIYPNIHLTIIGKGKLESELKKVAKKYAVENEIDFLGNVSHQNIPNLLVQHDIYIQPSIITNKNVEENSPISVLEALAVGMPVIASDIGGLKEIIKIEKNGFLVSPKSVDDIVYRLKIFIENPKLIKEMGSYARNDVQNNYSSFSQCQVMISLYEGIIHA